MPRIKRLLIPVASIAALALGWTATARSQPPDEEGVFHLQAPSEVNVTCLGPNDNGQTTTPFDLEVVAGPSQEAGDTDGSVDPQLGELAFYHGSFLPDVGFAPFIIPLNAPLTWPAGTNLDCPGTLPGSIDVVASAQADVETFSPVGTPASTTITFNFVQGPSIPTNEQ